MEWRGELWTPYGPLKQIFRCPFLKWAPKTKALKSLNLSAFTVFFDFEDVPRTRLELARP